MCSARTGLNHVRRYRLAVGLAPVAGEGLTPTSNRPRGLCGDFGVELLLVDDEAFVAALGDQVRAIVRADRERELSALHGDQLDGCGDFEAWRRRGFVAHVDVGSEGLFVGPVEMGNHGLDAGPLEKSDQVAGGEDFGHQEELWRFRIERRDGLRRR